MKIGLVSSLVPHIRGGGRFIVEWLVPHLKAAGHDVEPIFIPDGSGDALVDTVVFRMLDLANSCDRIITFRPPAHALKHPCKVVWFLHHERVFYDLWDSEYRPVPQTAYWQSFRAALHRADTLVLNEAHRLYCTSRVVQDRLKRFNGLAAEVIYAPVADPDSFYHSFVGDEIISVCRIVPHKRQRLMVEAMAHTTTPVRLRLLGVGQEPDYVSLLNRLVRTHQLEEHVTVDARWISEGEKRYLLSTALASVYLPVDEDSCGYPTIEAAHAGKATVTTCDSGGTVEFVEDGQSGLVVEPDPRAIAEAFDRLWLDRELARQLGRYAKERIRELNIDWGNVVERLTA